MPPVDEETREVLDSLFENADMAEELKRSALARLDEAAPVLTVALMSDGGQSRKVRHILWSLYTCSHLVPLGEFCSGLDTAVARSVAAAVSARLLAGGESEERFEAILRRSGEFDRRDRIISDLASRGLPEDYPLPTETADRLRILLELAESTLPSDL
ncbi:hypothetical protein ACFQY0_20350 [Haloferula chungangensis]|uniref:Uncharacterized protein n=1 Tax=Haloferula chungangensis TaxID=1048331 RepID=A0ABW2LAR5_9BACT